MRDPGWLLAAEVHVADAAWTMCHDIDRHNDQLGRDISEYGVTFGDPDVSVTMEPVDRAGIDGCFLLEELAEELWP